MDINTYISGLKCDNPNCNYKDMSIKVEDYKNWINAPCPRCGESLLTQEQYDETQKFVEFTKQAKSSPLFKIVDKVFDTLINDEETAELMNELIENGDSSRNEDMMNAFMKGFGESKLFTEKSFQLEDSRTKTEKVIDVLLKKCKNAQLEVKRLNKSISTLKHGEDYTDEQNVHLDQITELSLEINNYVKKIAQLERS